MLHNDKADYQSSPPTHVSLAREGARMTAQRLGEFDVARRDATLVAFLLATAEDLVDQALEMHDKLLGQQFKKGERKQEDQMRNNSRPPPLRLIPSKSW